MSDEYKPISCDMHSRYELWIMRGQKIKLVWNDKHKLTHIESVEPLDVRADSGVEYLVVRSGKSATRKIRLDHILSADPIESPVT